MNRVIDIGVGYHPSLIAPVVVGTTPDAIVIASDPKRTSPPSRKLAFDIHTGDLLAKLPAGYAPVDQPSAALAGGATIRVAKGSRHAGGPARKAPKDIELVDADGSVFTLATAASARIFVGGSIGGAVYAEPMAATPTVIGPRRDTERLVMTLARTNGPVLMLRLPWWVAASDRDARRLLSWRLEVCMRARVVVILAAEAFWMSLDALEQLLVTASEDEPITLRGIGLTNTHRDLPTLNTRPTIVSRHTADDPMQALRALLGWTPGDVTRDGQNLVLTERAAAALERALR